MNKLMISLIVLLTAVAVTTSILPSDGANADAENFGDWAYTVEGDSITVTGYTGTESEIVIPSMIEGKPVTAIGENAFLKNKTISEVTVPGTVTEIRNGAFDRSTVTTVVFDGEGLETIGTQAFFTCTNLVSIQFPDSLETIGQRAFKGCSALTDVGMPASVGKIASEAFSRCTNLESIVIPDGANVNPNSVFDNCENLLDITFAEGIDFVAASSFPNHAFYDKEGNPLDKAELKGNTFHGEKGEPIVMVINTVRTATFMANGEVFSTFVGEMGTPIEIPKEVPTTQGHTFVEWDGYTEGMILTKDVVFEAVYEINQYTITFKADGNVVSSQKMDYGAVIVAPEAPAKEGFVFIAWTGYTEGVTVARNMTFNAEYVPGTFTITYMSDGEEYLKATVEYGSVIKLPAQPTKEGYTFVEWDGYTEGMTVPAKDLVFNAVFEVNIYTIIFMANDEVVTQDKYEYGTVIVAPEAPAKEGYTFVEWDGYTEGMTVPADDMTFVAAYIINIYTASFDVDGEIYAEIEFEYSETIVLPEAPVKEGYTFSNWDGYVEGMTMPAHDVVFEAAFDVNFYRVIFTADEMTVYSEYLAFGDTIIAPEAPAKEGYTFAQWIGFTEGMTVPAEDVMFDAAYTVNTYNVYFMVDGDIYMKLPFDYGTTVTLPEDPEKEGYTFVQWDGYFVDMTMPACDVEFNAVFDINLYTVTFTADGNVVSSKDLEYGAAIVAPEAPEKIGYEFSNWNGYTLGMTVPADNVDFDAVYEVKQFNVDFVSDKAIVDSYLIDFGAVIVLPADPTKDGYTFVEWDNYSEGMTMPAHDIEFVAVFEVNTYTVTFVVDGQAVASGAYDYGSEIVVPADPVKEGHTFVKWDGYTPGMTVPAYNARFNAVFDVNLYLVTFMDEGKVHFEDYFEYGSVIVLPEEPTKEGYTFTGWDGYEEGMTVPAEDVLFDAKYTVNTYRVTFVADDAIVSTEELEYGSVIVAPAAPEKTGYTFSTWEGFTEGMTVPAKDVTFEATYTVNTYSASFMVDGEVYTKLEFDYGTKIVAPEAPEKIGHTFMKWNGFEEGMTMPANDVEFDAEFDVNVYTVIFMAEDEVVTQDKYEYGTVISTPEAPAKEGYTFSNWDGYTEGMTVPAEDVTFTAIYTVNNYKVSFTVDGELVASGPCPYGSVIVTPATPEKIGHTFVQWEGYEEGMTVPAHDVTFEAVFEINLYTVIFMAEDKVVTQDKYEYGSVIVAPEAPTKIGFLFSKWDGYTEGMTVPAEDVTFTAVYTDKQCLVTFTANDEIVFSELMAYGRTIIAPEAPAKEGYTFVKWNGFDEGMTVPETDVQFDAIYNVNQYTVTFIANEGLVSSEKMDYGAVIVAPEAPTMVGHSFSKWIGFKEGMTVPAEDIEFDAEYTINSYTVTFRADGNIVSSVEMEFGTEIVTPEAPEKVGYTFSKWIGFTEGMTVPSYNIVFDAEYTVNSYTVTFKAGDEIVSSGDYEYGTVIIAPEAPAVAGFEFVAWIGFTEGMTVPAEDVSFDAEYKDVRVTVTFMSEGKEFSSYKAVIGDAVILPEDVPTKENDADYSYVFDSWKGYTAEMVVKADVTFDAVFTAKTLVVIEEGKAIIGSGELVSVMIDDDALKAIKDGKASMVVKLKNGTVDVPASDVEKLVAGEIAIEKKGTSDNTTYTVAYGKNTEFGEPVTVTVPYELGERSIENVTVYDGDKKVDFQYEDGKMVFSTDHTATFAVEYCEPQKDNGLHLDILAEICILLAAVGSLLYVVMIRNKF